ncbi:protein SSUH2 homolog isoform X2 [Amia ocellicauda]|uniref:protein SSUH2 homolog isoform X2 n=1 Tax=Amia ocellicauda TaxID=2972642 RepID=UPI003464C7C0
MYNNQQMHGMLVPPMVYGEAPSAPPPSMFDNLPGYEGTQTGGGGKFVPPPSGLPYPPAEPLPPQTEWAIPSITEEVARKAFTDYVNSKCCYSSSPVEEATFTSLEAHNTYRYRLETFTESRSTEWSNEPFEGQPVDAFTQAAPGPWNVPVQTPELFKDATQDIKVPCTSSVKPCHTCNTTGKVPCKDCSGAGNKPCQSCAGSGAQLGETCAACSGRGCQSCFHCSGSGTDKCDTCKGKKQLLVFIKLTVKWTNNISDFVGALQSGFPVDKISKVSGNKVFSVTQYMVYPVQGFPDPDICQAAQRLVNEHQTKYAATSRVLQQRQTIELIPITKVNYTWKGNPYDYFVYGSEHKVETDNYPATCCCTIL